MPSTTTCKPGDVILVPFVFTSMQAAKSRPAVVLSVQEYHAARPDAVMMPLTSQASGLFGDAPVRDWSAAGLAKPTYFKACVQTIDRAAMKSRLGALSAADLATAYSTLRRIFGL
jgi:mRNA-degrading endonuclease toxin of MazEF toxin-antitoxin module